MSAIDFTPSTGPSGVNLPVAGGVNFTPAGGSTGNVPQQDGGFLGAAEGLGKGFLNLLTKNPIAKGIESVAAIPMQGVAKLMGQPDPYATGVGGGAPPVNITSSDQSPGKYAEEQAGNAATVASMFLPAGEAAGAVAPYLSGLGRFAPSVARIGVQTGIGAIQGLAGGMQAGQGASELPGSAATGAALGGGLATAGELGSALVDNFSSATPAGRLTDQKNNLRTLQRAFDDSSTMSTDPITTMDQNGLIKDLKVDNGKILVDGVTNSQRTGTLDQLIQDQQDMGTQAVKAMGNAGGPTVNPEDAGVTTANLKQQVVDTIKANPTIRASGNVSKVLAEVNRRFDDYMQSYGDTIPYGDLNSIRVAMNKVWDPESWDAEKAIGNAARSVLYNAPSGGAALKSAMQNEQELINAKEFAQKLAGTAVKGGRLGKYLADVGAGIVGSIVAAPGGPVAQGVAAPLAAGAADRLMNAYQTNYFSPMLSGPAASLGRFISAPAVGAAATLGKSMLIPRAVQQ